VTRVKYGESSFLFISILPSVFSSSTHTSLSTPYPHLSSLSQGRSLIMPYIISRFGETSVTKMRNWAHKHLPLGPNPLRILECGSGNGTLLLSFLTSPSSSPAAKLHLTGIDYSAGAATLAKSVEAARRASLEEDIDEDEEVINDVDTDWRVEDLLRHDFMGETWDLVMDKGTFDALALSNEKVEEENGKARLPSLVYPERVSKLVKEGGFFLITSCNFTEEEIRKRYTREGLGELK
jgi:hypothetical protein